MLVFHILESETERRFRFPDVPMIFKDLETGQELAVQPSQLREQYSEAADHFAATFRTRCREHGIDFVELDTSVPYDQALLAYLNKRRRIF